MNAKCIMEKGKRERNANFSREDTEKLVTLVQKYKNSIENKKSDAVTWQEKEKAWKALEAEYNCSSTGIFRDAKHLKLKYESIKRDTRKKCSVQRSELYKTGGGVNKAPPLTPVEEKVKKMILLSVEGTESTCDSDQLDIGALLEIETQEIETQEIETQEIKTQKVIVIPEYSADNILYTVDDSKIIPAEKKLSSTASQGSNSVVEPPPKLWTDWKPKNLKRKKHPALCKPKEKRPLDKLTDGKLEIIELQKTLINEELEEQKFKKQMMEMEMHYKKELHELEKEERQEIHELEKEERQLKIRILKCELENIIMEK